MTRTDLPESTRRIYRSMAAMTAIGTVVCAIYRGIPWSSGFLLGCAFSALNFWFFHRVVSKLGDPGAGGGGGTAVFAGIRYAAFFLVGYVILSSFEASVLAALLGCFLAVAAVILEVLYELIYGT